MKWPALSKLLFLMLFCSCTPIDPIITSIDPGADKVGAVVRIEGEGFGAGQGASEILFNGVSAGDAVFWRETYIIVEIPDGAQTGEVWIRSGEIESNRFPIIISRQPLDVVPVVQAFYLGDGYWVRDLGVGDFNEDGMEDLAVAVGELPIFLSSEDGAWAVRTDYYWKGGCGIVVVDHFDNDNHHDLACWDHGNEFYILFGDGEGAFGEPISSPAPDGVHSMAVADFDEDGFLDTITTFGVDNSARVAVHFADGLGGFGNPLEFYVGFQPYGVTTGDYDGDGHMDAAITNSGGAVGDDDTVSIVFGDGQGGFSEDVEYDVGDTPWGIITADFNGDNAPDLAVANHYSNFMSILLNDGLGGFQNHLTHPLNGSKDVEAGDYNGDGIVDLAFNASGGANIFLGYGDGTFTTWDLIWDCCQREDIAQGDFDGDEILDLAIANGTTYNVAMLTGDGSGGFGKTDNYDGFETIQMIMTGDFDEDGHEDIVVADNGELSLCIGNGEGGFSESYIIHDNWGCKGLVVEDLDRDGHLDIAAVCADSMAILLGDGEGGFWKTSNYELESIYRFRKSIDAADFNEDGITDLVVSTESPAVITLFLGDGSGEFPTRLDYDGGAHPRSLSCGDFNEDDHIDIAVAQPSGTLYHEVNILFGDGQGGLSNPVLVQSDGNIVMAVDIDLDGYLDLILSGIDDPMYDLSFEVLKGNGDGTFEEPVIHFGGGSVVVLNDFNGDALQDAVGVDWNMHLLFLSFGDGQGSFEHHSNFIAVGGPLYATSTDFNEDGHADVAVGTDGGFLTIFLGDGQGGFVEFND